MDYLELIILFFLSNRSIGLAIEDNSFHGKLLSKAQFLCPYASICDEPPLKQVQSPGGKISCCKDCSCKPECVRRNACCFPQLETGEHNTRSECLFPAASQLHSVKLRGIVDTFDMIFDVVNCQSDYVVFTQNGKSNTKSKDSISQNRTCLCDGGKNNSCDTCMLNITKCGECKCDMRRKLENGIEILVLVGCICDQSIRKEDKCTCGDSIVAPWGSMLPVYSRKTNLLYKNPVCAACSGVTDGIVWIPVLHCNEILFQDIDFDFVDNKKCFVYFFVKPENIENALLPICAVEKHVCNDDNFEIPRDLNMTKEEVIDACESGLNSVYNGREKNVFCAICHNVNTKSADSTCEGNSLKASVDRVTLLMTIDFIMEKTANNEMLVPRQHPSACSVSVPSDCRATLCPTGKIRTASGDCTYPMSFTYAKGYTIALRLIPEKHEDLRKIQELAEKNIVKLEHFISPWPSSWIIGCILLENTRLMPSGTLKNETAFVVKLGYHSPDRNQTRVLENIRLLLKKEWLLNIEMLLVTLRPDILEYTKIIFDGRNNK